jgi:hypothetical protein
MKIATRSSTAANVNSVQRMGRLGIVFSGM